MNPNPTGPARVMPLAVALSELGPDRTAVIAFALAELVPGVAAVTLTPEWSDGTGEIRRRTRVRLLDADGADIDGDLETHRAALRLLRDWFPTADGRRRYRYDVRTGDMELLTGTTGLIAGAL